MTFARVRALIVVAFLFITAGVVVIMAITRDSQTKAAQASSCPPGLVPAKTKMPERSQVTVNVFNGTKTNGLADKVANDLKYRGFVVKKTAPAPGKKAVNEIAIISYGPLAVGAAWLVSANFLVDQATMDFDIDRKGADVDVTIGTKFQQLATTTEVNQSIAALGNPPLPPGTCEMT